MSKTLTDKELSEAATRYVPDSMINKLIKEPQFRELFRNMVFTQMNVVENPQEASVHSAVGGMNSRGQLVRVELEIKMRAVVLEPQKLTCEAAHTEQGI